jgi:hypothetical protein
VPSGFDDPTHLPERLLAGPYPGQNACRDTDIIAILGKWQVLNVGSETSHPPLLTFRSYILQRHFEHLGHRISGVYHVTESGQRKRDHPGTAANV